MPRFENEGYNPDKNSRDYEPDRTVPDDENYYSYNPIDLNFNNRQSRDDNVLFDNQKKGSGINPCDNGYIEPPMQSERQQRFKSESIEDFQPSGKEPRQRRDKPSGGGNSKKPRRKKGRLSTGKKILIIILVIILILIGCIFPVLGRINYDDKKDNEYISSSELESGAMVKNILLLGVDARSEDAAESSRSDTMMLVSLDMKHHCIKLVSFLRDTWVYIPSIDGSQRLNAACTYGGYQGVVDTIEYNFGVDIDNYVVTDFEMFKVLVDSLGGVEIDVTQAEAKEVTNHPSRYGNVTLEAGKNTLTGEQALAYCRIRKIDTDFVRTERQRTVMSAIINSAKHANPFKLYKMAFNSAPYIETDMTKGELTRFIAQAGICITGDIHQTSVPFEGTWSYATISGNSVISIDTDENKEQLIDYIYNKSSSELKELENQED
ncbi:MAG: LCP family protein [Eubacterium sp.]